MLKKSVEFLCVQLIYLSHWKHKSKLFNNLNGCRIQRNFNFAFIVTRIINIEINTLQVNANNLLKRHCIKEILYLVRGGMVY